jgi:hypothetical protein
MSHPSAIKLDTETLIRKADNNVVIGFIAPPANATVLMSGIGLHDQVVPGKWFHRELQRGLRDELLNGEIFYTLREAQVVIESWRRHYNTGAKRETG